MSCMEIYSKDLRIRAVDAVEQGIPRREVVDTFSISLTTLKRWLRISREGKQGGRGPFAEVLYRAKATHPLDPRTEEGLVETTRGE